MERRDLTSNSRHWRGLVHLLAWVVILAVAFTAAGMSIHFIRKQTSSTRPVTGGRYSWFPRKHRELLMPKERWLDLVQETYSGFENRKPQVILIGDSITYAFKEGAPEMWQEFFEPKQALNLGIPGDATQNVLWRLFNYPLNSLEPDVVIVLIGVNNLFVFRDSPKETAAGVIGIVKMIQNQLPRSEVLLVGLLPVGKESENVAAAVPEVNRLLESWANERGVAYIDLREELATAEGDIRPDLYEDSIHLSRDGMRAWVEAIKPMLEKLSGEGRPVRRDG